MASPYPRDMVGYGAHPPDPEWPGEARVAVQFVIDQSVLAQSSPLRGLAPEDLEFEVLAPSLTPSDMSALTTTMLKIAQSIKLAEGQGWVSHPTAAKVFLKMLTELGVQVAIDDELTKVQNITPRSSPNPQGPGGPGAPAGVQPLGDVLVDPDPDDEEPSLMPRDPTGSELMSPTEQLMQYLRDRQVTGSTVTRKGNPV